MDMQHAPVIAGCVIGFCCLMGAFYYIDKFYPPGWEYELEKRNNRRALVLFIVGVAAIAGPLLTT